MLEERFNWWECNRSPVNACSIYITYYQNLKTNQHTTVKTR
ncbi:hypothetical protein MC7420_8064 [Coleofasciculus chthonoplastes PCC 7420]|uniref:Uncharacterized protein n=2 Tax=Coleofasciculus chthonoplastes TaxID=64178 RepID=B4VII1_9CYAN|nr:hypothetical protein MC7420_8064 [Coleofasciculus chthonoplastes PCC 7420]